MWLWESSNCLSHNCQGRLQVLQGVTILLAGWLFSVLCKSCVTEPNIRAEGEKRWQKLIEKAAIKKNKNEECSSPQRLYKIDDKNWKKMHKNHKNNQLPKSYLLGVACLITFFIILICHEQEEMSLCNSRMMICIVYGGWVRYFALLLWQEDPINPRGS